MSKKVEMVGKRFGKLTVLKESPNRKGKTVCWICKCDCGNITHPIKGTNLRNGTTKSCGCFVSVKTKEKSLVHGMCGTRIYQIWDNMNQRCRNPNRLEFKNYGGRGITVCEEWKNDFQAFYDYVSQLPHYGEEGYSLDRINNDGNYEPNNVRWATKKEQANNRRIRTNRSRIK